MSGVELQEVVFYNEDSTPPLTVLKPAGAIIDDVLLVVISDTDGLLSDITPPVSGWLDAGSSVNITGQRCKVFSHVVAAGDPGSWDFGYNVGTAMAGALARLRDADTTPTIVVTSDNTASNGSTMDSPTAAPTGLDDLDIAIFTTAAGSALTYIAPTGLTDMGKTQASSVFQGLALAFKKLSSSSATGAQTWTSISPTAKPSGTFTILIKSAGIFDPDPPRNPPPPLLPPWLMRQLIEWRSRTLNGSSGEPYLKESPQVQGAGGTDITMTTQALEVGDLIVAFHSNNWYTEAQLLEPTGGAGTWSKDGFGDNGSNNAHMQVWSCPITSAGIKTITFAPAVDEEHVVHLFVIAGADPTNPIDKAAGGNGAAATAQLAPSLTPDAVSDLHLCAVMTTTLSNYTAPPGMTNRGEVDVTSFCTAVAASATLGAAGATGTRTFTSSANAAYASASVAVRPVGGTVVGGASNVTLTPAEANFSGVAVDPVPQPVTVDLIPADIALSAIAIVATPIVELTPATAALSGVALVATPMVALTPATAALSGVALTAAPQPVTVTLTPATIAWSGVALVATPQPVTIALTPATATFTGIALSLAPQPVTVALTVATADFSGVALSAAGGGGLIPAVMTLSAVALTPVPQPVTVALTVATVTLSGVALSPVPQPVTVTLTPAGATFSAVILNPIPQPVTVALTPGVMTLTGVVFTLSRSVVLTPATATFSGVTLVATPAVLLAPATMTLAGVALTATPQVVNMTLSPAIATLSGVALLSSGSQAPVAHLLHISSDYGTSLSAGPPTGLETEYGGDLTWSG